MAEQYDTVGNKYEQFKDTAALPIPERHTFLKLVGDLHGQRALDLACGAGYYTRLLKQQGAENVIGVDVSPEMVAIARQREQEHRQGIQYQVANAAQLPHLGDFNLVTAIYLLNYAFTRDELLGMCRGAYSNLVEGGRFIAFTIDPNFVLEKGHDSPRGGGEVRRGVLAGVPGESAARGPDWPEVDSPGHTLVRIFPAAFSPRAVAWGPHSKTCRSFWDGARMPLLTPRGDLLL
ncbi:class I SAM-dependent methyltransferase [Cystobacter ferrugineus]|uniref:Methyltransferase domain-containing protein n=1 Tax=Cystobacter ferrugineus TaxID=83449 RepID=A0A1L9BA35_9BACT|nr:class I SAM-dependent methyltransferase [Cystobacter ferrugineus]OJH39099.1 hypothetical protein BON30_16220 [Cystobacter ferrugineus]